MSAEVVSRLFTALGENTKLRELHMAATNLTSAMVEPILLPLKVNHTLEVLNLESNFITGTPTDFFYSRFICIKESHWF